MGMDGLLTRYNTEAGWHIMMTSSNGNISALLALCAGNSPVPVNSPHKGQWRWALMFSLIYAWINDWVNNREAGDLRRQRGHDDVIVMIYASVSRLSFVLVITCHLFSVMSSPRLILTYCRNQDIYIQKIVQWIWNCPMQNCDHFVTHLKSSSAKWRPFYLDLGVLMRGSMRHRLIYIALYALLMWIKV